MSKPQPSVNRIIIPKAGKFELKNNRVYDPDGLVFVPKGVNCFPFSASQDEEVRATYGWSQSEAMIKGWKFNMIRVNHFPLTFNAFNNGSKIIEAGTPQTLYDLEANLDYMVEHFSKQKVVLLMDLAHDNQERFIDRSVATGDPNYVDYWADSGIGRTWADSYDFDGSLNGVAQNIVEMYRYFAEKYKDNAYVWWNPINEPVALPADPQLSLQQRIDVMKESWPVYDDVHAAIIKAIRSTGNEHPIFSELTGFGQDAASYIERYKLNNGHYALFGYKNLYDKLEEHERRNHGFCQSIYDQYAPTDVNGASLDRLRDYWDATWREGHTMLIVEHGSDQPAFLAAAQRMWTYLNYYPDYYKLGRMVWHWDSQDENDLTDDPNEILAPDQLHKKLGHGYKLDSLTDPTNLTELGRFNWDSNHDVKGLESHVRYGCISKEFAVNEFLRYVISKVFNDLDFDTQIIRGRQDAPKPKLSSEGFAIVTFLMANPVEHFGETKRIVSNVAMDVTHYNNTQMIFTVQFFSDDSYRRASVFKASLSSNRIVELFKYAGIGLLDIKPIKSTSAPIKATFESSASVDLVLVVRNDYTTEIPIIEDAEVIENFI